MKKLSSCGWNDTVGRMYTNSSPPTWQAPGSRPQILLYPTRRLGERLHRRVPDQLGPQWIWGHTSKSSPDPEIRNKIWFRRMWAVEVSNSRASFCDPLSAKAHVSSFVLRFRNWVAVWEDLRTNRWKEYIFHTTFLLSLDGGLAPSLDLEKIQKIYCWLGRLHCVFLASFLASGSSTKCCWGWTSSWCTLNSVYLVVLYSVDFSVLRSVMDPASCTRFTNFFISLLLPKTHVLKQVHVTSSHHRYASLGRNMVVGATAKHAHCSYLYKHHSAIHLE